MKKTLKFLTFVMIMGILPVEIFAWQGMPTPPLHVEGRNLKDPCGNNIALHGWMQPTSSYFNGRFYSDPSTFTPEDCAEALNVYKSVVDLLSNPNPLFGYNHGWYNNFVRIWPPSDGWNGNGTVDEALQDRAWYNMYIPYIEYCRQNGVYVVLIGNAPDGGTFMSAQHKSNMIAYWTRICNRYPEVRNADNVMFEICNEPVAIESVLGNGDWGSVTQAHDIAMQTYFQDIVDAIRATGFNNVIWVPGLIWQDRLLNFATYPISGGNIGYAGHMYPFGEDNPVPINERLVNSGWKACSDLYPVIVTEGSWHTMEPDQGLRTGTTEGFGTTVKNFYDTQGNISWICGMTEELIGNMEGGISAFTYPEINCGRAGFDWWPTYASNAPTDDCGCDPTGITPYVQVNDGAWQQVSSVTINSGDKVKFGPQPVSGGSWSWSGCGTSGTSREQTIYPTSSCTATATYTNSCGAQSTQNFNISVPGSGFDGVYSFIVQHSGKAIDVAGGGTSNGTNIHQWAYSGSNNNQRFQVTPTDNGYYRISPVVATGQAIDVDGVSTADGANIHTWAYGGGNNQQWRFEDQGGGYYKIIARHSDKCLDVDGVSTADGANIHQWTCIAGAQNQAFEVIAVNSSNTEVSINEMNIFPNPAVNGEFTVNIAGNASDSHTLTIYSYDGKKVFEEGNLSSGIQEINTGLTKGIYFVKINDSNNNIQKLIIE